MSAWINALGAMLQTGGEIGLKRQEDERDAEIKRLADLAKEDRARLRQLQGPATRYQTKRNGPGGEMIEEVNEESYNPETEARESKVISSYTAPPKEKRAETDQEAFDRDPVAYAARKAAGRAPAKPSSPKVAKDPKLSSLSTTDVQAMFGVTDAEGNVTVDQDAYRRFLADKAIKAKTDPRYNDAKFAAQEYQAKLGFDPNERPPGTFEADESYMKLPNEKTHPKPGTPEFGAKLEQLSTPEKAPAAPAAPGTKPSPAPYPEGTKLVKDGKTYIVKNGEPVPYGG